MTDADTAPVNPLRPAQEQANAEFMLFGPPEGGVELVSTFGPYEAEYAAIRKGVGILDQPQRGLLRLTGADRLEFLNRFLTCPTKELTAGQGVRGFLLSTKGRIQADLAVLEGQGQTLLETDRFSAPLVAQELEKLLFGEDVHLEDLTDQKRVLSLHGPAAAKLLGQVEAQTDTPLSELGDLGVCTGEGLMRPITVFRRDETGALGLHVISDAEPLGPLYLALAEVVGGLNPEVEGGQRRPIAGRGIGWMAYNAARVEAGTPLYRVDYGPDTLPHETGELVHRVVSFNKGCYRGQEVVARMHSLGHPKRVLVGLRLPDQRMPIATAQLLEPDPAVVGRSTGKVVGAVTSSTLSPMLGGVAVCLAMVGWGWHEAGKTVLAPAEGELIPATVGSLRAV